MYVYVSTTVGIEQKGAYRSAERTNSHQYTPTVLVRGVMGLKFHKKSVANVADIYVSTCHCSTTSQDIFQDS